MSKYMMLLLQGGSGLPGTKGWDRKWRALKINRKPEPERPLKDEEPAAMASAPKDPLYRHEALHASVADRSADLSGHEALQFLPQDCCLLLQAKEEFDVFLLCRGEAAEGSDEDDLFDWDSKAKEAAASDSAAGRKRDRAAGKDRKTATSPAKKRGRKAALREAQGQASCGAGQKESRLTSIPVVSYDWCINLIAVQVMRRRLPQCRRRQPQTLPMLPLMVPMSPWCCFPLQVTVSQHSLPVFARPSFFACLPFFCLSTLLCCQEKLQYLLVKCFTAKGFTDSACRGILEARSARQHKPVFARVPARGYPIPFPAVCSQAGCHSGR